MNIDNIKSLLAGQNQESVNKYVEYCTKLTNEKRNGQAKNPWMAYKKDAELAGFFKSVTSDGLVFDGVHITLQSTGVSYDYVAYKNKMFLSYPESIIDLQLVYKDDEFSFKKESGRVFYTHKINNLFDRTELDIVGGYCVIKNKRGEFLTSLSKAEFEKHRKVAKTDFIWKAWFVEMCMKTLIKKACKTHFSDVYQNMETVDNENSNVEQSLEISIETKQDLETIETIPELTVYYKNNEAKNSGIKKDFVKACSDRKESILKLEVEKNENS